MNLITELKNRNLYHNCTDLDGLAAKDNIVVYAGFDATAPSLHVGNLATIMTLKIFKKYGHKIIVLLGGATTKIGDPSGKDSMRKMLTDKEISDNKNSIKNSIMNILGDVIFVDNNDWFCDVKYIDLLRDVGSLFSVNRMLTMDSVSLRLEREHNLSFLEFNYMILQSYDFWFLYQKYNCNVQIGGSDQWGNIVCGLDLIHKKDNKSKAFGLTIPLITRSDGKKMGKSEDGAVWLDPKMLDDFSYFQYFRNVHDNDVKKMMLIFTDLAIEEIESLFVDHKNINDLKVVLAFEATKTCRGLGAANAAKNRAETVFVKNELDESNAIVIDEKMINIIDLLVKVEAVASKGEARRLLASNGVKISNQTITDIGLEIDLEGYFMLSVGKKRHFTVILNNKSN